MCMLRSLYLQQVKWTGTGRSSLTLHEHPEEGCEMEVSEENVSDAHHHARVEEEVLKNKDNILNDFVRRSWG